MALRLTIRRAGHSVRCGTTVAVRWLGSRKLTVAIMVFLVAAIGGAWALDSTKGGEFSRWYVSSRVWYIGLWGLLAVNIAFATWVRFPRHWNDAARLLVPVGLILILAGWIQTLCQGIEGRLILWPGEAAQTALNPDRSQITLLAPRGQAVQATELGFAPGPADWSGHQALDFGEVDGVDVKVLDFYRHARYQPTWVADEAETGQPAVEVSVIHASGRASEERWCLPDFFDRFPPPGELNVSIKQAPVSSWRDDFLQPPSLNPGSRGVLSAHYGNRVYPILVDGNIGQKIPLGDTGREVEIVEYYANAKSDKDQFSSEGDEPRNPMLKLRIYAPDSKAPIPEIAYANQPFVNFELLKKQECPVKFWYHHPATPVAPGVEFLQTPDGTLCCRVGIGGRYEARGEVKPGDDLAIPGEGRVSLLRYIPHARRSGAFRPMEPAGGPTMVPEAAALVEVTAAGKPEQFWLRRNDAELGVKKLDGPGGPLVVMFGYERHPLDFSIKLMDFQEVRDSRSPAGAARVSQVSLSKGDQGRPDPARTVATNRPLHYGMFTLYQAGFQQLPGKVELSVLRVTSDPGRALKYSGAVFAGGGILFLAWLRASKRRPGRALHTEHQTGVLTEGKSHDRSRPSASASFEPVSSVHGAVDWSPGNP